jgi:hypothetical protein
MVEMIQRLIRYRVPDVHPNPSVGTHTAVFMNKIVTWNIEAGNGRIFLSILKMS